MKKVQMNLSVPEYVKDHIYGKAETHERHPAYILTKIMDRIISDELIELPEFLLEMSKQMNEQPNRSTAHPFWQVRCKRYIVTAEGYNEHHWILCDDDGEFFRSDTNELLIASEYFSENHKDWFNVQVAEFKGDHFYEDMSDLEIFADSFDFDYSNLPGCINRVFVQEIEEVIAMHFTEVGAMAFIKRKQHDYPKLYTYVESAYWSPQLRQLQDWIIGLSEDIK